MFHYIRKQLELFDCNETSERALGMILAYYTLDIQEGIIRYNDTDGLIDRYNRGWF